MSINAIRATQAIEESYRSYLTTAFALQEKELQDQLVDQLKQPGRFVKGPILEATPYFRTGSTIEELICAGILSEGFKLLNTASLPLDRPLYLHQERAIRKLTVHNRNIVVATGTGSGKTETFMVPILNYLLRELEKGTLTGGVRALLLYPMNALANDQMVRLRSFLQNCPNITFGRYTSETEQDYNKALTKYRNMYHSDPIPNELISREQMRESPPHILLTNYAMLEYLLLRPKDSAFFDGTNAGHWRFIVIDEAHTYSGAKGIEMAMLLRRLKERVVKSERGRLQCIATSATLGRGREGFGQIVEYASQLFGEPFEWIEKDPARQDVVEGIRIPMVHSVVRWGEPKVDAYQQWKEIIGRDECHDKLKEMADIAEKMGVPNTVLQHALHEAKDGEWRTFLYNVLRGDGRLLRLQSVLQEGAQEINIIAERVMKNIPNPVEHLVTLVELASQAKADDYSLPLLPARYHVFVRAIEGAYLRLTPDKKIFLERRESEVVQGREHAVFEVATCRQCGSLYLVGKSTQVNGKKYLKQSTQELQRMEYYLLADEDWKLEGPDEDDEVGFPDINIKGKFDHYILCGKCGAIDKEGYLGKLCECKDVKHLRLLRVPANEEGKVCSCPACGRRSPNGMVWRFLVGADAAASVLGTALFQQIEPKQDGKGLVNTHEEEYDPWNPGIMQPSVNVHQDKGEASRKLLVFSDSRQDAAFFAPYLNRTYNQILHRSLIIKVMTQYRREIKQNKWRLQNLVEAVYKIASELKVFEQDGIQDRKNEVWKWLFQEFLALDKHNGLEGLGLIQFSLAKPEQWDAPIPLQKAPWNMTPEEIWTLFQVLLDSFRVKGAVLFPDWISPKDDAFQPRNREFYFRAYQHNARKGVLSWNTDRLNARLDYLVRVAQNLNSQISVENCREVLKILWDRCLAFDNPRSMWKNYFHAVNLQGEGVVYQIRHNIWEIASPLVQGDSKWYICDKCHNITPYNIRGTCPTYRCNGKLYECSPEEVFADNHYYKMYRNILPVRMQAEEHTAQLSSQAATELQNRFVEGEISILSCSTTFELGVDVGELEAVFMRNMPPSASNYIQRAGRAGRRADSAAYVLTYAQRRSHDLTHFYEPWRMVSGEIRAPYFTLDNLKIVLRHVYATAISAFWAENPGYFGTVDNFFFGEKESGPEKLRQFLSNRPKSLHESLRRIVPEHLHSAIHIDDWGWINFLLGQEDGVLSKAGEEVVYDVNQIEETWLQLVKQRKRNEHLLHLLNTIKSRDLLNFMSSHNIIPKYGFPVDVVELQLYHHGEDAKRLQLERDLRVALSEYAPSSQIVAAGKLWTSRYIKKLPTKAWERYRYVICPNCQGYHRVRAELLTESQNPFTVCPTCKNQLTRTNGDFIVPSFGFIASTDAPGKPGDQKPEKTYTTRVYYSGQAKEDSCTVLELNGVVIRATPASHGRMAIVNSGGGVGFKVCFKCGYAALGNEKVPIPHPTYWGGECREILQGGLALGHEFETDILKLHFDGYSDNRDGFWFSVMYALLEGASEALQIERQDLNGCLYPMGGDMSRPAIILFDDVPGGAGHVRRIARKEVLQEVLQTTLQRLTRCECGGAEGNASCYGCLRNYHNQFCHDQLNRGMVIRFLTNILPKKVWDIRDLAIDA